MKFIVIGITDNPQPFFPPEVQEIIRNGKVFSGGKRHHEIVESLLPPDTQWIDIAVPLDAVFEQYRYLSEETAEHTIVVFASGDPLFFGFANTIQRKMPEAEVVVYPHINNAQTETVLPTEHVDSPTPTCEVNHLLPSDITRADTHPLAFYAVIST